MTRPVSSFLLLAAGASSTSRTDAAFVPSQRADPGLTNTLGRAAAPFRRASSSANGPESTCLCMSKNADRARMEKNLEDLMDHDWRVFRAQLVLQEEREAEERKKSGDGDDASESSSGDVKLDKQEKLGNLFAGVINSIFSSDDNDKASESTGKTDDSSSSSSKESSIFDGDAIGGATPSSVLPYSKGCQCQDPFASPRELPAVSPTRPEPIKLDRHRWAHGIPHIEPGCVLVANERLGGVFHQTVVLVIDHIESAGSTGIVINRPMPGNLQRIASEQPSNVNLSLKLAFADSCVTYGGPVMPEEYSILHSYGEVDGATTVAPGVFVGGSEELMHEVRRDHLNPKHALFVKGHVAWAPGQLQREVTKGVWYPASVSADFILRYAGAPVVEGIDDGDDLWSDILTCLGGKYAEACKKARQQKRR